MTVTTTTSRTKLPTNGSDTAFVFDFQLLDSGDFNARHIAADLTETDLVLGVDYTLSASPWTTGGTLTTIGALSPLANGNIVMWRDMDYEQLTDLLNNKGYEANNLEDVFDRMTLLSQQLNDENDRTLTMAIDSLITNAVVEDPLANAVLKWNADADAVENGAVTTEIVNADANAISAAAAAVSTAADVAPTAASAAAAAVSETAAIAMVAGGIDINWIQAAQVGNDLTITNWGSIAMAALSGMDIAYMDDSNDDLRVYRFNGTVFAQVGNDLNISGVGNFVAIAALNDTDIVFFDIGNDDLRVYRWTDPNWAQVGNDLNIPTTGTALALAAALNSTDVAFFDNGNDELRLYRWDGSDFTLIGGGFSIITGGGIAMTALNSTDVAFFDSTNEDLRVYRWTESTTSWAQVGNDFNIPSVGFIALAALNGTDVAFIDNTNDDLHIYRFDGADWSHASNDHSIAGASGYMVLTALNGTDVAYIDNSNDDLRLYRFAYYVGDGPHMLQ